MHKVQMIGTEATAHSRRRCARRSGTTMETRLWPCFCDRTGAVAPVLWAKVSSLGPLSPGAYKYPLGVLRRRYPEFLGVVVILFLGVEVILSFLLLLA